MLYLYPTKRNLGVEIVGSEEELLDLYDSLLELIECSDGMDDHGVVNLTPANAHLFDFLDLLRHPLPAEEEDFTPLQNPDSGEKTAGKKKQSDKPGESERPKVLAFPGVRLPEGENPEDDGRNESEDGPADADDDALEEGFDATTFDRLQDLEDLPPDVLAALEEFRSSGQYGPRGMEDIDNLILEDDLIVRLLWPEAVHLAFSLHDYLGWSASVRDADWTREIRWRPAYGTVLRFQAQLIDCASSAVPLHQADQVRELLQNPKVSVREICFQYLDLLGEEFVRAAPKRRKAMLAPVIAEIAKPGARNAQILKEAEAKAKELGCPIDEIAFTGEIPEDTEW